MKATGPTHERETIIRLSEDSKTVEIWTASNFMYRKLRSLGFDCVADGQRHAEFVCTVKNLGFRRTRVLSEAQKAQMVERGKKLRQTTTTV